MASKARMYLVTVLLILLPGIGCNVEREIKTKGSEAKTATVTSAQIKTTSEAYKLNNGPYVVEEVETLVLHDIARNKNLEVRIYYPREGGPYPLIIFSPGLGGSKDDFSQMSYFLAGHGYCLIHPTHSDSLKLWQKERGQGSWDKLMEFILSDYRQWVGRLQDVSFIIDSLTTIEEKNPVLKGKIDHRKIGVGGYSYGAHTAQLIAGAKIIHSEGGPLQSYADERVRAVVLLSGQGRGWLGMTQNSWDELIRPMLYVTGTRDKSPVGQMKVDWRLETYIFSPPPDKYLLLIDGMDHSLKRTAPNCPDIPEPMECIKVAVIAFWDAYLKDDKDAKDYLMSDKLEKFSNNSVVFTRK